MIIFGIEVTYSSAKLAIIRKTESHKTGDRDGQIFERRIRK